MSLIKKLEEHSTELGEGVGKKLISDLEAKLLITIPLDFKNYLLKLNYAELYGDPVYGIHRNEELSYIDLYTANKFQEHFRYGFLNVFTNDLDGTIFIRPDTGAVYNASFITPLAASFTEFVEYVLTDDES